MLVFCLGYGRGTQQLLGGNCFVIYKTMVKFRNESKTQNKTDQKHSAQKKATKICFSMDLCRV